MRRSKLSDEQMLAFVRDGEPGPQGRRSVRTHRLIEQTYYRRKAKYGGMDPSEMQRLQQLEGENRRLKRIVAEHRWISRAIRLPFRT
jgi:putative transposase